MLITAIEPRRKSLRALYLDGELAVNIDAQTLLSSRFQVGTEITDEELHELLTASDANRAKEKALYLIAHRDHSKKELVDKIRRTASQEAAEKAADRTGKPYFGCCPLFVKPFQEYSGFPMRHVTSPSAPGAAPGNLAERTLPVPRSPWSGRGAPCGRAHG